ncbi:MAG: tetratricopeptide repeat protein [Longimicrobiales bacterium]|nr:tetratricopeptide repeat protein [Longimicrobiales bacterium]
MRNTSKWMVAIAALALAACGGDEGERVELGEEPTQAENRRANWPDGVAARVDSANLYYSNGDYEAAAEVYRDLTEEYPEISTVWFGLYMAESALGNEEAAAAALEKAEGMAPGLGQMHEAAESSGMGDMLRGEMPAGHPSLDSMHPQGGSGMEESGG